MELNDIKRDTLAMEQGEWVDNIPDMGELRLKVRSFGNADCRRLYSKLVDAVPRGKRPGGRLDPVEQDRIISSCLLATCLLDWDGINQDGKPVPYSKELASSLLNDPAWVEFRSAVFNAANNVGQARAEAIEADAKN